MINSLIISACFSFYYDKNQMYNYENMVKNNCRPQSYSFLQNNNNDINISTKPLPKKKPKIIEINP